jgi:hypothetical protein
MSINLMLESNVNKLVELRFSIDPESAFHMLDDCPLGEGLKQTVRFILSDLPNSDTPGSMKERILLVLNPPVQDDSLFGNFAILPTELLCKVFSKNPLSELDLIADLSKTFQQVSCTSAIAFLHLENELKARKKLNMSEIEDYRTQFEERYGEELSYSKLFSYCPQLTHLDLSFSDVNDDTLDDILKAVKIHCGLQGLNLTRCVRLTSPPDLSGLIFLETLEMLHCSQMAGQLDLKGLTQLKILSMTSCVALTGLLNLEKLTQLQILNLRDCTQFTGRLDLRRLVQLRILNLEGCGQLIGLRLGEHRFLETLILEGCVHLGGLFDLAGLDQLETLNLNGTVITGLVNLHTLNQLKMLYLCGCTGLAGILDVSGLYNLQRLHLQNCTGLLGLFNLNELSALKSLFLDGCIGFAGELDLEGLDSLQALKIKNCSGITNLVNVLPSTTIMRR